MLLAQPLAPAGQRRTIERRLVAEHHLATDRKQSCPFLAFSKQETFPDFVFIYEFNAGSLQSGLDRPYGLLGNQSSLFFKIDDWR